jgi:hypothetical protein
MWPCSPNSGGGGHKVERKRQNECMRVVAYLRSRAGATEVHWRKVRNGDRGRHWLAIKGLGV